MTDRQREGECAFSRAYSNGEMTWVGASDRWKSFSPYWETLWGVSDVLSNFKMSKDKSKDGWNVSDLLMMIRDAHGSRF